MRVAQSDKLPPLFAEAVFSYAWVYIYQSPKFPGNYP